MWKNFFSLVDLFEYFIYIYVKISVVDIFFDNVFIDFNLVEMVWVLISLIKVIK